MVVGGYLGGGSIQLSTQEFDQNDYSAFRSFDDDAEEENRIQAGFGLLEVHGGATYSLTNFFHLGMELTIPVFVSLDGFAPYTTEFVTPNPGINLKIIFGNLG